MQAASHWLNDPIFAFPKDMAAMPPKLIAPAQLHHVCLTKHDAVSPTATIKSEDQSDMSFTQSSSGGSSIYDEDGEADEPSSEPPKATPKRKRANRYKNASPAVLSVCQSAGVYCSESAANYVLASTSPESSVTASVPSTQGPVDPRSRAEVGRVEGADAAAC
jgi:hypothetical protein